MALIIIYIFLYQSHVSYIIETQKTNGFERTIGRFQEFFNSYKTQSEKNSLKLITCHYLMIQERKREREKLWTSSVYNERQLRFAFVRKIAQHSLYHSTFSLNDSVFFYLRLPQILFIHRHKYTCTCVCVRQAIRKNGGRGEKISYENKQRTQLINVRELSYFDFNDFLSLSLFFSLFSPLCFNSNNLLIILFFIENQSM